MSEARRLVSSILKFLEDQKNSGALTEDALESLEVASQCLESAYSTSAAEADKSVNLLQLFSASASCKPEQTQSTTAPPRAEASPQSKEEAEKKKAEGNELMKQEKYEDAVKCYTDSIALDSSNAVYYCNRAAALIKLQENRKAVDDCDKALQIDPAYSKAHGRKGLAHTALNEHIEARECFQHALQLDPTNISYQNNLEIAEQKIREAGGQGPAGAAGFGGMNMGGMDFSALLGNPALMNMATSVMANPQMQNMLSNLMSGANSSPDGQQGMGNLLQVGQQLAQQMQQSNPDLVEQLRSQMRPPSENPDGGNA